MKTIKYLIEKNGYKEISTIKEDDFGRFHGIVSDKDGKLFFIKASKGRKTYRFSSLAREATLSEYLSRLTQEKEITLNGYRLVVPRVEKIVDEGEVVCLISDYVKGEKLLDKDSGEISDMLLLVLELLAVLSIEAQRYLIVQYLKNYSKNSLFLSLPIKLLRGVLLSPSALLGLLLATKDVLFLKGGEELGLVHADINASNILVKDKNIYLTDWEEAGWGISHYNAIGPLSVHWQDEVVRKALLDNLYKKGLKKAILPLLAYRTLVLFNQRLDKNDPRRIRDWEILNFIRKKG